MNLTRAAFFCALSVAPVFSQEIRIAPYQLSPIRDRVDHFNGTSESTNWSGYAVTGSSFTSSKASWIVPAAVCSGVRGDQYAALWVGLDGFDSSTVEQTGTISYCSGTTPGYYVWFEFYPQPAYEIGGFVVNPGNVITASVTYANNRFTTTITNESTGRSYSTSASVSGAPRSSAEWVIEAPATTVGRNNVEILPLADFGTGFFGFDYTNQAGTNDATDSAVSGPIDAFGSNIYEINKVSSSTSPQTSTCSVLASDGTSFSCTWAQ